MNYFFFSHIKDLEVVGTSINKSINTSTSTDDLVEPSPEGLTDEEYALALQEYMVSLEDNYTSLY